MLKELQKDIRSIRTLIEDFKTNIIGFVVINNKIDSFITEISHCGEYFSSFKITPMLAVQTEHNFPTNSGFYRLVEFGGITYDELLNDPFKFQEFLKDNGIIR